MGSLIKDPPLETSLRVFEERVFECIFNFGISV